MKFILSLFIYCSLSFGQGFTVDSDTLWLDNGADTLYDAMAYGFAVPTFDGSAYVIFDSIAYVNDISTGDFTIMAFVKNMATTPAKYIISKGAPIATKKGFDLQVGADSLFLVQTRNEGAAQTLSMGSVTAGVHSLIAYRSGGDMYTENNGVAIDDQADVVDVAYDDNLYIGAGGDGFTGKLTQGQVWRSAILNRAMTSAERTVYHADGTIPSDALIIPCNDEDSQTVITGFQGSTKYEGTITDATFPSFWANTVDHPSASWLLRKGWNNETTWKRPADLSGNIPGTTTKVSNVAGDWLNGAVMLIDWNPYDYDILDTAYTRGANSWGINDYEFGDTLDGVFFKNTATSIKESDFFIYDTDGATILGKYLYETGGYGNQRTPRLWRTIRTPR